MAMKMKENQRGAALFVALIVLLVITLMGVSSLKSGIFHERMSMNSQADTLTFMGAESSINSIISFAWQIGDNGVDESFFAPAILTGQPQLNCVAKDAISSGNCTASQTFDRRAQGVLIAQADTTYEGQSQYENNDAKFLAYHDFETKGTSYFVRDLDLPFAYQNLQEWKKLGVPNGFSLTAGEMDQE